MNAGKSSLLNFLTAENSAIVSPIAGTTTDPVRKAFELLDFGPVIFVDTAGFDDQSEIGLLRVQRSLNTLHEVDLALFVPLKEELDNEERRFVEGIKKPYIIAHKPFKIELLEQIKTELAKHSEPDFFGGRIERGDTVVLVCPIDSQAPTGKLIMPQIAALRTALDLNAIAITVQPSELSSVLRIVRPRLVVTDSQAFAQVSAIVPKGVEISSFSILLAELKGDPKAYKLGLEQIAKLRDGDRVLLVEHCSHQTSCQDIARVKIPRLLQKQTGTSLVFDVVSGREPLPSDLSSYAMVIQCGGCIATRGAILSRIEQCRSAGVPITNYGMLFRQVSSPDH